MVIAASRPVLDAAGTLMGEVGRLLPVAPAVAHTWLALAAVPLLGSLITEPAVD